MFGILALFIGYVLLAFGAVLPSSWLVLPLTWVAAAGLVLVVLTIQRRAIDLSLIILFGFIAFALLVVPTKFAIGLIAGVWAWAAARDADAHRIVRFMHILLLIGVLESLLGLVQFFVSPGWIFGYINPYSVSSGTLINRNHFAGLLEMLFPISIGLAYTAHRRHQGLARPYLYLLAGGVIGLAIIFSLSRTGILCLVATLFFFGVTLQFRSPQRKAGALLILAFLAIVAAGALWIGIDVVVQRYSELAGEEALVREGRLVVFRDAVRMITKYPLGVGGGNFQDRFREYQTFRPDLLFDHAHNDYLETAAEWGLPLAAGFWAVLAFVVIRGVRLFVLVDSPEKRGIFLACSGSILTILLHSLTDFNLQIPSNAIIFFTFVGISLGTKLRASNPAGSQWLKSGEHE
jgi:O-antigen ligase